MPIKVISQLIMNKYLPDVEHFNPDDVKHREQFKHGQSHFTERFDYFVGTSTGGLIAFCLAINYDTLDMSEIYSRSTYYFSRNHLGPFLWSKYDPSRIHAKIDEIIGTIVLKNGKRLSAHDATLLDMHNYLNPDDFVDEDRLKSMGSSHGNELKFTDAENYFNIANDVHMCSQLHRIKREKVLLITAYNATSNSTTIFNTSYANHWSYRIADVLKATMAAPTYFPPHKIHRISINDNMKSKLDMSTKSQADLFIDGGVFANDPELVALWAIRMQWKKLTNYHLLAIGTGCYTSEVSATNWGGYCGWIFNGGQLVNTLMDATRSLTEMITNNLAKFNDIKRMKFNFILSESMSLDDPNFVQTFDNEWKILKNEDDFKALVYFYDSIF
jgi:predicted acylesterase/phospholipase RssA